MTDALLRPATRADLPAIVAMLAEDTFNASWGPADDPAYAAAFDQIEADRQNTLVVADRAGDVIGTMQLTYIPSLSNRGAERLQIESVRVRSDQRGRGLGHEMIRWAVEQAKARGCGLVQLTTDKRRVDAHRFYASLGFIASHEGMKLPL
ncbi:GNAT family N-acetyltransferase [Phytohabitans kaempferiae]|uniref:GNAT family N-acetyltransferase n=1 Tax=Phytohabitans kaempferiae TaxID=1620943 RepID=A0ABV6M912_9ACTN